MEYVKNIKTKAGDRVTPGIWMVSHKDSSKLREVRVHERKHYRTGSEWLVVNILEAYKGNKLRNICIAAREFIFHYQVFK